MAALPYWERLGAWGFMDCPEVLFAPAGYYRAGGGQQFMREDFPYLGPQPYGHASSPELWNGASRKDVMRGSASSDWEAPH